MNDQVLHQPNDSSVPVSSERARLKLFGWLIRLASITVILIACSAIAFSLYQDVSGKNIESPAEVVESVTISEVAPENAIRPEEVSPASITACINQESIDAAEHPLIPLLEMAEQGAQIIEESVQDYTAVITKQIRWKGKLQPEQKVFCKIRHANCTNSPSTSIPFSVYTRFITPKKGQEAIWVEGCHDGKLVAHGPTGLLNLMTVHLEPEGNMAMSGNLHPIHSIGMLNLIRKMIDHGTNDLKYADCDVKITRNFMINDARCTRLEIVHEEQADHFEFHRAEIYIDDDRNLPIAFRSFLWPDKPGGRPRLLERYYYTDIKLNVGLTDEDFQPDNESYDFPGY